MTIAAPPRRRYWDAISRSYAPAVAGTLERITGASRLSTRFEMVYTTRQVVAGASVTSRRSEPERLFLSVVV